MSNPINNIKSTDTDVLRFLEKFKTYVVNFAEQSVKIKKTNLNANRAAVVIQPSQMSEGEALATMLSLGADKDIANELIKKYNGCSAIGFGIDKDKDVVNYRVYIEHAPDVKRIEQLRQSGKKEVQSIWSIKWNAKTPNAVDYTNYFYQLDVSDQHRKNIIEESRLGFIPEMSLFAYTRHIGSNFRAVNAGVNKRVSAYISISESITTENVSKDVYDFTSADLDTQLKSYGKLPIAMFATGSSNDEPFITIYFRYFD